MAGGLSGEVILSSTGAVLQTVEQFSRITGQPTRPRAPRQPKRLLTAEDLAAAPRRRSERGAGKAAVNYDESALDRADGSKATRARRSGPGKDIELAQGKCFAHPA